MSKTSRTRNISKDSFAPIHAPFLGTLLEAHLQEQNYNPLGSFSSPLNAYSSISYGWKSDDMTSNNVYSPREPPNHLPPKKNPIWPLLMGLIFKKGLVPSYQAAQLVERAHPKWTNPLPPGLWAPSGHGQSGKRWLRCKIGSCWSSWPFEFLWRPLESLEV